VTVIINRPLVVTSYISLKSRAVGIARIGLRVIEGQSTLLDFRLFVYITYIVISKIVYCIMYIHQRLDSKE